MEGSWSKPLNGSFSSSLQNGRGSAIRVGTVACVTHDRCRMLGIGSVYLDSMKVEERKGERGRKEGKRDKKVNSIYYILYTLFWAKSFYCLD